MMQELEDDLMLLIAKKAPRLQTGELLFSSRMAIARAMLATMSDEMRRIDAERLEWDRKNQIEEMRCEK